MDAKLSIELFKEEIQADIACYEQICFLCSFSRQARAKKSACADFFTILENNIDIDVIFKEAVKSIVSLEHIIFNEEFKVKMFLEPCIDKAKRSRYDRINLLYLRAKHKKLEELLLNFTIFFYKEKALSFVGKTRKTKTEGFFVPSFFDKNIYENKR